MFFLPVARRLGSYNSKARRFANEGSSGIDRLGFGAYAEALAGLFSTGEQTLPAAVGIYAPWGGGKVGPHTTPFRNSAFA